MLEINETEILSKSLYMILKTEDLFKKTNFHERYKKQLSRIGQQFNNLNRKKDITNNHLDEYLKWMNEKTPDLPFTKYECLVEITTLLCNFGLSHYEFLKRFFIETLFLDKLQEKTGKRFDKIITYGALVNAFQKLPSFDQKMNELLDVNLRNALAHDTWYFENGQMKYNLKNKIVEIPLSEIPQKINIIGRVYSTITRNYFEDFFPEMVKGYEDVGSKKINEIFPLYGMNED